MGPSCDEPRGLPLQHGDEVNFATFSPDGQRIATASTDRTAQLWDPETSTRIGPPFHHLETVNSVNFSPDGQRIITASDDGTARIWKIAIPLASDGKRLADLAEALGGFRLGEPGQFIPVPMEERMQRLRILRLVGLATTVDPARDLSSYRNHLRIPIEAEREF